MGNKVKIIFCCKNNFLFTFGEYRECKGCFETVFNHIFKDKNYECSFEYYFPNTDKNGLTIISGNNVDSQYKSTTICEKTMKSAIKSLVENNDSDLYCFVEHRLVMCEDDLLYEIVKSKNLKQLYISATRMPLEAEEYIKEHNGSICGTPLKLAIFDYSDLWDSVEFFGRAFNKIAKDIEGQFSQTIKNDTKPQPVYKLKEL